MSQPRPPRNNKHFHETIQVGLVGFCLVIAFISIPKCEKEKAINKQEQEAMISMTAMEAGLVQKVIPSGNNRANSVIWTTPDE